MDGRERAFCPRIDPRGRFAATRAEARSLARLLPQGEAPDRYVKIATCVAPATTHEAVEQCMIDNLPVQ